jgi:hypothetical protein
VGVRRTNEGAIDFAVDVLIVGVLPLPGDETLVFHPRNGAANRWLARRSAMC